MTCQARVGSLFSICPSTGVTSQPVLLTTTDGIIEDATSASLAKDGKTLYYTTNDGDIDRRDIWAVPTSGSASRSRSRTATGIETYPMPFASGQRFAAFSADARRPQSVGVFQIDDRRAESDLPDAAGAFPMAAHVDPTAVTLKAADGFEFYNQLFVPKDIKPGEKRPAMVFVHGGPQRQMLLGYHYRHVYHMAYAVNQWLASQGYIVMSVNYRSGVGYGRSFRTAPRTRRPAATPNIRTCSRPASICRRGPTSTRSASASGDSRTAACSPRRRSRATRTSSPPASISPASTSGAARSIPTSVSFKSSAISAIDKWKSPVLLFHGDDDRNVAFQQTTGLVQLLRARNVEYELIVFPDDVHDWLLHSRWIYTFERMDEFLKKYLTGN